MGTPFFHALGWAYEMLTESINMQAGELLEEKYGYLVDMAGVFGEYLQTGEG